LLEGIFFLFLSFELNRLIVEVGLQVY